MGKATSSWLLLLGCLWPGGCSSRVIVCKVKMRGDICGDRGVQPAQFQDTGFAQSAQAAQICWTITTAETRVLRSFSPSQALPCPPGAISDVIPLRTLENGDHSFLSLPEYLGEEQKGCQLYLSAAALISPRQHCHIGGKSGAPGRSPGLRVLDHCHHERAQKFFFPTPGTKINRRGLGGWAREVFQWE